MNYMFFFSEAVFRDQGWRASETHQGNKQDSFELKN